MEKNKYKELHSKNADCLLSSANQLSKLSPLMSLSNDYSKVTAEAEVSLLGVLNESSSDFALALAAFNISANRKKFEDEEEEEDEEDYDDFDDEDDDYDDYDDEDDE